MKKRCRLSFNKEARRDRKQIPTDNWKSIQEGWVSILHKALTFKNIKEVYYGIV